jgi:hypothetical protein
LLLQLDGRHGQTRLLDLCSSQFKILGVIKHDCNVATPEPFSNSASQRCNAIGRTGLSPHWIKVKNRQHPAFGRVMDPFD